MSNMIGLLYRVGFKLRKYAPDILVVLGVAGTGVGVVMACKKTTKVNEVLEPAKKKMEEVKEKETTDGYSEKDRQKDTTKVMLQTGVEFVKLYGPSVGLIAASLGAIIGSHSMLRSRYASLGASYAALGTEFAAYRNKIKDIYGDDADFKTRFVTEETETEEITQKNGHKKEVKKTIETVDIHGYSQYAKFFDDGCRGWTKDPEYNLMVLKRVEEEANERLRARGYLFLNTVYEMLGIPKTQAGAHVGWLYDEKNPTGDNYVDFGIYSQTGDPVHDEPLRRFVNGDERTIMLDFNVDGDILCYFPA